jgi:hypothetical protein
MHCPTRKAAEPRGDSEIVTARDDSSPKRGLVRRFGTEGIALGKTKQVFIMSRTNKIIRVNDDNQLLAGILAREGKTTWELDGQVIKAKDIVPKLKARIAAVEKTAHKKAEWQAAIAEEEALLEETNDLVSMLRQVLRLKYKSKPDALAQFGLSPERERRALTAEETLQKVTRVQSTRLARGTRGKRQREKIHGNAAATAAAATPAAIAPVSTMPSASQPAAMPPVVNGASH